MEKTAGVTKPRETIEEAGRVFLNMAHNRTQLSDLIFRHQRQRLPVEWSDHWNAFQANAW